MPNQKQVKILPKLSTLKAKIKVMQFICKHKNTQNQTNLSVKPPKNHKNYATTITNCLLFANAKD